MDVNRLKRMDSAVNFGVSSVSSGAGRPAAGGFRDQLGGRMKEEYRLRVQIILDELEALTCALFDRIDMRAFERYLGQMRELLSEIARNAYALATEDIMVRYHRMRGHRTLWLPGTDHAAIATQSKVEKQIAKDEKKNRHDLGREEFLKRVRDYAQTSHDYIVKQVKSMGASLDWSREAYTLDATRERAVLTAFRAELQESAPSCALAATTTSTAA